jgi:hypothetical protein
MSTRLAKTEADPGCDAGSAADVAYHLRHTCVLVLWAVVSYLLQKLANRSGQQTFIRFTWATADVVLFTSILYMAEPPRGPLLIGYPLLVTAAGLFFRVSFVAFMAGISIAWSPRTPISQQLPLQ